MTGRGAPPPATVVSGGGGRGGGGTGEGALPPTRTVTVLLPGPPLTFPALTFTTGRKQESHNLMAHQKLGFKEVLVNFFLPANLEIVK